MSRIPVACRGCNKSEAQVAMCNIYTYKFKVFGKKCPREMGFEPTNLVTKNARSIATFKLKEPLATNIRIADLESGVFSPRMQFDPKYITKLAEDIEAEGQLKPIMVRPHPTEPNRYQVIDGEHRVRAFQKLGKTLIRAEIHALSDEEAYYRAMRINQLHGKSLEELEEACHISKMMQIFGLTQEQLAKKFSRPQKWISERLSLAQKLAPQTEEQIIRRRISTSHAIEIAELPKDEQAKVVEKVVEKKLRRAATRGLVHAVKKAASAEQKEQILEKPLKVYADTFKDSKQLETALLTIGPEDDFLAKSKEIKTEEQARKFWEESKAQESVEAFECPGCGRKLRVDWAKGEVSWD
jgi:ParB/RepB/Spo0J family partition protein